MGVLLGDVSLIFYLEPGVLLGDVSLIYYLETQLELVLYGRNSFKPRKVPVQCYFFLLTIPNSPWWC